MKLDAVKFGLACAAAFSILWVVCSLFVMGMPMNMMHVSGNMVHGDFTSMQWSMGIIVLVAFTVVPVLEITKWMFRRGYIGVSYIKNN